MNRSFPLSPSGLAIIAYHNGVTIDQLPEDARFSSNAGMHEWMEALGKRYAESGLMPRIGDRWMLPKELGI